MRISDWSSDVCSSDLVVRTMGRLFCRHLATFRAAHLLEPERGPISERHAGGGAGHRLLRACADDAWNEHGRHDGSEVHSARLDLWALHRRPPPPDRPARMGRPTYLAAVYGLRSEERRLGKERLSKS